MKKSKSAAIASFIFGLAFWIPLLNLIFGIIAVVLGLKALAEIKKEPRLYEGKWFAVAGIFLGALPLVILLIGAGMCLAGYDDVCKNIGFAYKS